MGHTLRPQAPHDFAGTHGFIVIMQRQLRRADVEVLQKDSRVACILRSDERGADGHGGALDRVLKILLEELPLKQAAKLAAQLTEARDNEAYKRALQLKAESASQ